MTAIKRFKIIIEDRLHEEKLSMLTDKLTVIKEIMDMLRSEVRKEKENDT